MQLLKIKVKLFGENLAITFILMINSMAGKPGIPPILMDGWMGLAGLFCVVDLVVDVSFYSIL